MASYKKEYWNKSKTKCVIITRSKLSDGYNYYLMFLTKNASGPMIVNERFKQKVSITSEKDAIQAAKKLL